MAKCDQDKEAFVESSLNPGSRPMGFFWLLLFLCGAVSSAQAQGSLFDALSRSSSVSSGGVQVSIPNGYLNVRVEDLAVQSVAKARKGVSVIWNF
jgi:hypothetical protein